MPFTSDYAASFLVFPLQPHDVALCLGFGDSDVLLAPCSKYPPSAEEGRTIVPHPALRSSDEPGWIATLPVKEMAVARSLARDLYSNGQWSVFSRLVAIVGHGGSIG